MSKENMLTKHIPLSIVDTPDEAPNYNEIGGFTMVKIKSCIIVGKGMESNKPSVDLQLEDEKGNKFLIMTTGNLIEMVAGAIKGKREKDGG